MVIVKVLTRRTIFVEINFHQSYFTIKILDKIISQLASIFFHKSRPHQNSFPVIFIFVLFPTVILWIITMLSEKKHCNNKHKIMQSSILTRWNQPMLKRHRVYKVVNSLIET